MHHILHIYPLGSPTLGKLIILILQRVDWGTAKDTWIGPNSFQKPGTKSGFQRYHCNTTGISLLYLWCSEWQKRQSNASLLTKIKTNPTQYNTSNWTGTGTKKTVPVFFPPSLPRPYLQSPCCTQACQYTSCKIWYWQSQNRACCHEVTTHHTGKPRFVWVKDAQLSITNDGAAPRAWSSSCSL